jgi:hypothetical protein
MRLRRKPAGYEEPTGVSPRVFVETWQKAESIAEVARRLNRTKNAVKVRAHKYRQKGVPLKFFASAVAEGVNWDVLATLAREIESGPPAPPAK